MNRILILLFLCMPVMLWAQRLPVQEKQKELQERVVEVSLSEIPGTFESYRNTDIAASSCI